MSKRPSVTLADSFTLRLVANPFSAMRTVTVPEVAFSRAAAMLAALRYWPKADISSCTAHVRFRRYIGHDDCTAKCPLMTQSGHALSTDF
jgi:hypothetical protein